MCVLPITARFKPVKIELEKIQKKDLPNYSSIKELGRKNFCDFLIKKYDNTKITNDYNVFRVFARRRWFNPQYVFGDDIITLEKNTPIEVVSEKIYEGALHAANIAKNKTMELAKKIIRK